ncbi:MAG: prepilin-type N-terminal cleavage/methylation domain-containing protein [Gammaproteobacteria bacterium]|nr:MAG: prepilin-type N-terminal cleavage/methylation domain-containing protein [Gammaproteobacteria bacterium]
MRRQTGFSLIELMIGITLLGLLLVLAAPTYSQWMINSRIRNAAESIQNGLRLARNEAVQRDTNVRFELTSSSGADWQICVVAVATDACSATKSVTLQQFNASGGAKGIVVGSEKDTSYAKGKFDTSLTSMASTSITFNALGRPTDSGGGTRRLVTTLSVGGSLRTCDPQLAMTTSPQGCS